MLSQHVTSTCLTCSMYNVMRSNFLCPWTFSKFKWWVRWVKKPFSQILFPPSLVPPKFSLRKRPRTGVRGYKEESLQSRGALSFWNETQCLDTSKKESEGRMGQREVSVCSFRLMKLEFPMSQLCARKRRAFELGFSCSFSDVHIYTYVYICLYRDLFLPWR